MVINLKETMGNKHSNRRVDRVETTYRRRIAKGEERASTPQNGLTHQYHNYTNKDRFDQTVPYDINSNSNHHQNKIGSISIKRQNGITFKWFTKPKENSQTSKTISETNCSAQKSPQSKNLATNGEITVLPDQPAMKLDSKLDSRLICKYEIIAFIGKGSFSQVIKVQHRLTGKYYAVKLVSTEQDFEAVNNELSILSRVNHRNIIKLEEVYTNESTSKLFIVMEIASGGEMYERVVAKGRYTESEALDAVRMLLTGLVYLHTINITHRDLKPENLLYSDARPDARLLITDFGLAHQGKNENEKMTATCGTPEYVAPEILLRIPYSNKVDMWSVGVISYILMSGIMPFDDILRSRLYTQIITADYVYYPNFWSGSEIAKKFVDSLLQTDGEQRLSATEALRHNWISRENSRQQPSTNMIDVKRAGERSDARNMQRSKSSRSIKSVTRSDHEHKVRVEEIEKLAEDLQLLASKRKPHKNQSDNQRNSSVKQPKNEAIIKNYGVI